MIAQGLGEGSDVPGRKRASPRPRGDLLGEYKATTLTDGSGGYEVDGVPEGRVTVTASLNDQGFLAGSGSAALEGDGQSVEIDVALRDAGSVTGRIVPASEEDRAAGRTWPPKCGSPSGPGGGCRDEHAARRHLLVRRRTHRERELHRRRGRQHRPGQRDPRRGRRAQHGRDPAQRRGPAQGPGGARTTPRPRESTARSRSAAPPSRSPRRSGSGTTAASTSPKSWPGTSPPACSTGRGRSRCTARPAER